MLPAGSRKRLVGTVCIAGLILSLSQSATAELPGVPSVGQASKQARLPPGHVGAMARQLWPTETDGCASVSFTIAIENGRAIVVPVAPLATQEGLSVRSDKWGIAIAVGGRPCLIQVRIEAVADTALEHNNAK